MPRNKLPPGKHPHSGGYSRTVAAASPDIAPDSDIIGFLDQPNAHRQNARVHDDERMAGQAPESLEEFVAAISRGFGLNAEEQAFVFALTTCATAPALASLADRLKWLHRSDVAEAVDLAVAHAARIGDLDPVAAASQLIALIEDRVPFSARVVMGWLQGRAAERSGHTLDAEAAFERAAGIDPTWPPVLLSLAGIANDRGDAERGLSLLTRAGMDPDDGLYRLLMTYRSGRVLQLRRNDPCWCGSGQKLKHCHREPEGLPLHRRATWLYHKASAFLQAGPWREEVLELAIERSRYWPERDALLRALDDPLVMSSMLWEGSILAEYILSRGALLPEDELELAVSWLTCDRSLFQVEEVRAGEGLLVRDLRLGGTTFVHEVLGSQQSFPGMLFATIMLPVGDGRHGFFGGIDPIRLDERHNLIELMDGGPEPIEIVEFLTRRFAPMRFATTTGEALQPCEVVLRIPGRTAIVRTFDAQFTKAGKGEWLAGTDGLALREGETIGAQISASGRDVTINTMSQQRMDMMLEVMSDLGFEFEVIAESHMDINEELAKLQAAADAGERTSARPALESDPDLAEFLEQRILDYERKWLDESIPALDGFTPRQAAADPTRRGDLVALLNSFPSGVPRAMDADRLRAALSL